VLSVVAGVGTVRVHLRLVRTISTIMTQLMAIYQTPSVEHEKEATEKASVGASILVAMSVLRKVGLGRERQRAKRVSCVDRDLVAQKETLPSCSSVMLRMIAFRYQCEASRSCKVAIYERGEEMPMY
jgi:hypothetical protein